MNAPKPVRQIDPAGLDQLLLAAAKGITRFAESALASKGMPVQIWDGKDGLGAVLGEHIAKVGVPNERLPQLLTPRLVVNSLKPPKRRIRQAVK